MGRSNLSSVHSRVRLLRNVDLIMRRKASCLAMTQDWFSLFSVSLLLQIVNLYQKIPSQVAKNIFMGFNLINQFLNKRETYENFKYYAC